MRGTTRQGVHQVPTRRVILLGASNLRWSISTVVPTARESWGAPLDLLGAFGHGRSYGIESWVLGRSLPGIVDCALWETLPSRSPATTAALVTDVGNDLLYGVEVRQIIAWVQTCLERLANNHARTIVTELPIENLERLGPLRYNLFRSILFPRCRLTLAEMLNRARELNQQLLELAHHFSATTVQPQQEWYGIDPIHIRKRGRSRAWREIFSNWTVADKPVNHLQRSLGLWLTLQSLKPFQRHFLGRQRLHPQPCARLSEGSLISLY